MDLQTELEHIIAVVIIRFHLHIVLPLHNSEKRRLAITQD